ncbi:hypothetical protein G6F31_019700 [Rhizopus arrhizus]|nr:hypothetical protein G6F31_019700 [Rhizopus arrhizus]
MPSGITVNAMPGVSGTPWHQLSVSSVACRYPSSAQSGLPRVRAKRTPPAAHCHRAAAVRHRTPEVHRSALPDRLIAGRRRRCLLPHHRP